MTLCGSTLHSTRGPNVYCTRPDGHDGKCFDSIELQDGETLCLEWHFVPACKHVFTDYQCEKCGKGKPLPFA
jgi:hypothetical protein